MTETLGRVASPKLQQVPLARAAGGQFNDLSRSNQLYFYLNYLLDLS